MRVLLVILLNVALLLALTIASVHFQQMNQRRDADGSWVHSVLIVVCLTQFMMTAVWAAVARRDRLLRWFQGLVLAVACPLPFFIGWSGVYLSKYLSDHSGLALLVLETHLAIAVGWGCLLLITRGIVRLIERARSPQAELPPAKPPATRQQAAIEVVCSLLAMGVVIGYAGEILPLVDHLAYIRCPVPEFGANFIFGGRDQPSRWLVSLGPFAVVLAVLLFPAVASVLFIKRKKRRPPSPDASHALPVVRQFGGPGLATLCAVSVFFFGLHAFGSIDQFKLRVLGKVKRNTVGQVEMIGQRDLFSWVANDRTLACLEDHTSLRMLGLFSLSISDSGLAHLRGLKDLEGLVIAPFGRDLYLRDDSSGFPEFYEQAGLDYSSPITDEGLRNFQDLKHLKGLDLPGLDISDKGLVFFSGNEKLVRMDLSYTRVTGTVFHKFQLTLLQELNLRNTQVQDVGLSHLSGATNLRTLNLGDCDQLTDAGLMHLKGLTALETLNLYGTKITGTGFSHLKGLANLQSLWAANTKFTDMGLVHLAGFTNLQKLSLLGTPITDVGLEHLKGLTGLQTLVLGTTKITDAGLVHLKGLTSLQALYLESLAITDAGLVHLKGLIGLRELKLAGTQITDAGLKHLTGLKNLRELPLVDTEVSDVGVAELKEALPDCNIIWWPSSRGPTWSPSSRLSTE